MRKWGKGFCFSWWRCARGESCLKMLLWWQSGSVGDRWALSDKAVYIFRTPYPPAPNQSPHSSLPTVSFLPAFPFNFNSDSLSDPRCTGQGTSVRDLWWTVLQPRPPMSRSSCVWKVFNIDGKLSLAVWSLSPGICLLNYYDLMNE